MIDPGQKKASRSERDARKARLDDIDGMRREVRQAVAQHGGGHATLIPAPSEMRAEIPVFEPQPKAVVSVVARLKAYDGARDAAPRADSAAARAG